MAELKSIKNKKSKQDSFANVLTGLGVKGKDRRLSVVLLAEIMTDQVLEEFLRASKMARIIIERIPLDGTRKWININNIEADLELKIETDMKRLRVRKAFREAWQKSRLYGGSIIFMGINDGEELSEPVNKNEISDISNLIVFGKDELDISSPQIDDDLNSQNFGMPITYRINSTRGTKTIKNQIIHHTRVLRFDGEFLPVRSFITNNYWHDSVLNSLLNPIRNYSTSNDSIVVVLNDFRIGVLKMTDLIEKLSGDCEKGEDEIRRRLSLLKETISVLGIMVINEEETYEQNTPQLNGVDKLLDKVVDRLVAETGIPRIILLGESPSGMQSTGSTELKNYYDNVSCQQEDKIRPNLDLFFEYIFTSKQGPTGGSFPESFSYNFNSLFQLTEKEASETKKNMAEADMKYLEGGVLDATEIALSRFGGDTFNQETTLAKDRIEEAKKNV